MFQYRALLSTMSLAKTFSLPFFRKVHLESLRGNTLRAQRSSQAHLGLLPRFLLVLVLVYAD